MLQWVKPFWIILFAQCQFTQPFVSYAYYVYILNYVVKKMSQALFMFRSSHCTTNNIDFFLYSLHIILWHMTPITCYQLIDMPCPFLFTKVKLAVPLSLKRRNLLSYLKTKSHAALKQKKSKNYFTISSVSENNEPQRLRRVSKSLKIRKTKDPAVKTCSYNNI